MKNKIMRIPLNFFGLPEEDKFGFLRKRANYRRKGFVNFCLGLVTLEQSWRFSLSIRCATKGVRSASTNSAASFMFDPVI